MTSLIQPQCQTLKGVDRAPYSGDVAMVANSSKKEVCLPDGEPPARAVARHVGGRDLHESSFSLSGV